LAIDQKRFDSIGEREEKKRKRWKGKIIRWHLHSIDSQWSERDERDNRRLREKLGCSTRRHFHLYMLSVKGIIITVLGLILIRPIKGDTLEREWRNWLFTVCVSRRDVDAIVNSKNRRKM
jgi:hypothetical protein